MASAQDKQPPVVKGKEGFLDPLYVDIIGLGSGAASGVVAAAVSINNKFFANAERDELFRDLRKTRREARKSAHDNKSLVGTPYIRELQKIEGDYSAGVAQRLEEHSINNYSSRLRTLAAHQKTEVLLNTVAVAAITLGAFANLASGWRTEAKGDKLEERLNALEGKHR